MLNLGDVFIDLPQKLLKAAKAGNLQLIRNIIEKNPLLVNTEDKEGRSLLLIACNKQSIKMAEFLIESGANINNVSKNYETPLIIASKKNDIELVKLLFQSGAKLTSGAFVAALKTKNVDMVKLFLDNGANVNCVLNFGTIGRVEDIKTTPLIGAFHLNAPEVAKLLIENNKMINYKDEKKFTAFKGACYHSNNELIELLIKAGAKPLFDELSYGLDRSIRLNHWDTTKLLLKISNAIIPDKYLNKHQIIGIELLLAIQEDDTKTAAQLVQEVEVLKHLTKTLGYYKLSLPDNEASKIVNSCLENLENSKILNDANIGQTVEDGSNQEINEELSQPQVEESGL